MNIPDPQHGYYDIEDPDLIEWPILKSALLTVESGVVARVLEPGSGEAPAQQIQINHNKGSLAGFELDLWEKINVCAEKKNITCPFIGVRKLEKKHYKNLT
jgi:hypothetical protein